MVSPGWGLSRWSAGRRLWERVSIACLSCWGWSAPHNYCTLILRCEGAWYLVWVSMDCLYSWRWSALHCTDLLVQQCNALNTRRYFPLHCFWSQRVSCLASATLRFTICQYQYTTSIADLLCNFPRVSCLARSSLNTRHSVKPISCILCWDFNKFSILWQ